MLQEELVEMTAYVSPEGNFPIPPSKIRHWRDGVMEYKRQHCVVGNSTASHPQFTNPVHEDVLCGMAVICFQTWQTTDSKHKSAITMFGVKQRH